MREKGRCAMYEPTLAQIGFEDFGPFAEEYSDTLQDAEDASVEQAEQSFEREYADYGEPCDCSFAFTSTHETGAEGCECNPDGSLRPEEPKFKFPTVPVRKDLLWNDLTECAVEQAQRQFEADEVARLEQKIIRLREES